MTSINLFMVDIFININGVVFPILIDICVITMFFSSFIIGVIIIVISLAYSYLATDRFSRHRFFQQCPLCLSALRNLATVI